MTRIFLILFSAFLGAISLNARELEGLIRELEAQLIPLEAMQESLDSKVISSNTTVFGTEPDSELFKSLEQKLDALEKELQNIEARIAKEQLSMAIASKKESLIDIKVDLPKGVSYRDLRISINGQDVVEIPNLTTKANFHEIPVYKGYLLPGTYRLKVNALAHHPNLVHTKPMNIQFTDTMVLASKNKTTAWVLKLEEDKGRFFIAKNAPAKKQL